MSGGWGMALRLARRETRRRPGRTALVALLVGVPVAALVIGLTVARTVTLSPEEARAASRGQADEVVDAGGAGLARRGGRGGRGRGAGRQPDPGGGVVPRRGRGRAAGTCSSGA